MVRESTRSRERDRERGRERETANDDLRDAKVDADVEHRLTEVGELLFPRGKALLLTPKRGDGADAVE